MLCFLRFSCFYYSSSFPFTVAFLFCGPPRDRGLGSLPTNALRKSFVRQSPAESAVNPESLSVCIAL